MGNSPKGLVIWLTGLSGSGKTTLAWALWKQLKRRVPELVILDGDRIRAAFGGELGYREEDRIIQIKRLQKIAQLLSGQGIVVIVAAVYSNPDLLSWNRKKFPSYFEILLEASLETLCARDPKGLYAAAAGGQMKCVVGLDIPWLPPRSPDLVINTDMFRSPQEMACQVIEAVPALAQRLRERI